MTRVGSVAGVGLDDDSDALPEIVGPVWLIELETTTPIREGSGPGGGGALLPGSVVQVVPHIGSMTESSQPLKEAGAPPPLKVLFLAHCAPQKFTEVPVVVPGTTSPTTNEPPAGKGTVQVTVTLLDVMVPAAFVTEAWRVSVPVSELVYVKLALPLASATADPVVPAFGPEMTEKLTVAPSRAVPQAARLAVTVAGDITTWV